MVSGIIHSDTVLYYGQMDDRSDQNANRCKGVD